MAMCVHLRNEHVNIFIAIYISLYLHIAIIYVST